MKEALWVMVTVNEIIKNMNPDNKPFNALMIGTTNLGNTRHLASGKLDYIFFLFPHISITLHMMVLQKGINT